MICFFPCIIPQNNHACVFCLEKTDFYFNCVFFTLEDTAIITMIRNTNVNSALKCLQGNTISPYISGRFFLYRLQVAAPH